MNRDAISRLQQYWMLLDESNGSSRQHDCPPPMLSLYESNKVVYCYLKLSLFEFFQMSVRKYRISESFGLSRLEQHTCPGGT